MVSVYIPSEQDIRRWVKEAVKEYLNNIRSQLPIVEDDKEPLLNRKQAAAVLKCSLVTLGDWTKKGLPAHRVGGRVYYLEVELLNFVKRKKHGKYRRLWQDQNDDSAG